MVSSRTQLITQNSGLQALSSKESAKNQCVINSVQLLTTFRKVQVENEGTELTIKGMEDKGDGVIVVKVSVPPDANKEDIHRNLTQSYEQMAGRLEDQEKNIDFLQKLAFKLADKSVILEVKATAESNSTGNESTHQSSNLNVGRDATGSTLNIGNIEGKVTNTNNEQLEST